MSTGSGTSSAVKNLRAIFETKRIDTSDSSPSRGRSPDDSTSSTNSRPVSKVRANFIAVERPGEEGQQHFGLRKASDMSSSTEGQKEQTNMEGSQTLLNDAVIEPLKLTSPEKQSNTNDGDLGAILKGSAFETGNSMQLTPEVQPEAQKVDKQIPKPRLTQNATEKSSTKPVANGTPSKIGTVAKSSKSKDSSVKEEGNTTKTQGSKSETASSHVDGATDDKKGSKPVPAKLNTKASNGSSSVPKKSPSTANKPPITPTGPGHLASKIRGGPAKIQGVMRSAEAAKQERAAAAAAATATTAASHKDIGPPSVASKTTTSSSNRRVTEQGASKPSLTSVSKAPRQSLSTKLPSAATAPTAASAARKESNEHKTDNEEKAKPAERKATIPHAPKAANNATAASLARKSARTSLAGTAEERPKSRTSHASKPASEGFLARLTKPTASSTSRAHEKVEVTSPPRSRQVSASHRQSVKKSTGSRQSLGSSEQSLTNGTAHSANTTSNGITLNSVAEDQDQQDQEHVQEEEDKENTQPEVSAQQAVATDSTA